MINKPILSFHCNFHKISGPLVSGETKISFDVPELFEHEIEGIVRLTKQKNLLVVIYDADSITNEETITSNVETNFTSH